MVVSADRGHAGVGGGTGRVRRRSDRTAWLLLMPSLLVLGSVSVYPIIRGLVLSLRNTSLAEQKNSFVGLSNYANMLADDQFWSAWSHTLYFTVASTALETVIGLAMALILHEQFAGRGFVRACMLVPWAIPTVVTSKMFGWLFDSQNGIVNYLLKSAGLIGHDISWYSSTTHAMQTIIVADVWKTTPFMALLLLAGLQTVPKSLVEAAVTDGANPVQVFWHVRLPILMPTLLIAGLFRVLDAYRIFDLVYVLTGGGPADSTETMSTLTYKTLFSALQFGYGSALSTAMFVTEALIALAFGIFIVRRMRRAA